VQDAAALPGASEDVATGKALVRRLIDEVMNTGRLEVLEELYSPGMAVAARRWIEPFRAAFSDIEMNIVALIAEGNTVVARLRCSGTHRGHWQGHPPTGRRFRNIDEVYFFTIDGRRITSAWGLEDNDRRTRQLGV
jgi:predicted ester cyclase